MTVISYFGPAALRAFRGILIKMYFISEQRVLVAFFLAVLQLKVIKRNIIKKTILFFDLCVWDINHYSNTYVVKLKIELQSVFLSQYVHISILFEDLRLYSIRSR